MQWRNVGPFRGGRTRAVAGVPSQPNVFYIGAVNGGVWKTNDYGRTWKPIFDTQPPASVGAIAVAPSDPNIVYVGSGEGLHRPDLSVGDGIYKSTDAGQTWTHLGLRDGQQIPQIAVDPHDPNRLFVAVLVIRTARMRSAASFARPTAARASRRSCIRTRTSAPMTWRSTRRPEIVYATLWEAREGPWENGCLERHERRHLQVNRRRHNLAATCRAGCPTAIVQAYVAHRAQQSASGCSRR